MGPLKSSRITIPSQDVELSMYKRICKVPLPWKVIYSQVWGDLHVDCFEGQYSVYHTRIQFFHIQDKIFRLTTRKVDHTITGRHLAIFGDIYDSHHRHLVGRDLREEVAISSMSSAVGLE